MKTTIERQTELLSLFVERMPMYIGEVNKKSVVDFINGFGCGSDCDHYWTKAISDYLDKNYKIKKVALGWPHQVEVLSKINNENWNQTFVKIIKVIIKTAT